MQKKHNIEDVLQDMQDVLDKIRAPDHIKERAAAQIRKFKKFEDEFYKKRFISIVKPYLDKLREEEQFSLPFEVPPGPEVLSTGEIPLGKIVLSDETFYLNCLHKEEFSLHTLVVGATGASKSTLVKPAIIAAGMAGCQITAFSPKREELYEMYHYFGNNANYWPINDEVIELFDNPFEAPCAGADWDSQVGSFWFDGRTSMRFHLTSCIKDVRNLHGIEIPSLMDLERYVSHLIAQGYRQNQYDRQALFRLQIRIRSALSGVKGYACRKGHTFSELMSKHNFFLTEGITSIDVRSFFVKEMVTKIWTHQRSLQEKPLHIIFIDDAQPLIEYQESMGEGQVDALHDILLLGRSDNIGLFLVAQNYSQINKVVRGNVSTIGILRSNHDDAFIGGRELGLTPEQIEVVKALQRGQALMLRRMVHPKPFLVHFPDFKPGRVPLQVIREVMQPEVSRLKAGREEKAEVFDPDIPRGVQKIAQRIPTDKKLDTIMGFLQANSNALQEDVVKALKITIQTTSRMFQTLQQEGLLEEAIEFRTQGTGGIKFYKFTEKAEKMYGVQQWPGKGNIEHSCALRLATRFYEILYPTLTPFIKIEYQIKNGHSTDVGILPDRLCVEIANQSKAEHEVRDNIIPCLQVFQRVISASFETSMQKAIIEEAKRQLTRDQFARCAFVLVKDFVKTKNPAKELLLEGGI